MYEELLKSFEKAYRILREAREMHDESHTLLSDCHKFMNSICDVGVDMGFRDVDHSWAVICIHGNKDYMKFVDMSQADIRTIASFLKQFQYSNRVTDSPLAKGMIEDMIIKKW
jgi:hypothetical protein